jgi:hypothetical protein
MTRRTLSALPLLLLASAPAVEAADPRVEIIASADGFCPPCLQVLLLAMPPNSRGTLNMTLVPPSGQPGEPWSMPVTTDGAGMGQGWFPLRGPGLYVVEAHVGGAPARPGHTISDCNPPWQPPSPIDCPPPSPFRGPRGQDISLSLARHAGASLQAVLERLTPGRTPRWIVVRTSRVTVGADGGVKVPARDVKAGVYRVRFVDGGRTVASRVAEIQSRTP